MIFKDQELIAEAYNTVLNEAHKCACGCSKCGPSCPCDKNCECKRVEEGLDSVGKEDEDINNDNKVDSTDKYLAKRRAAIAKAKGEEEEDDKDEKKNESVKSLPPEKLLNFKDLYNKVMSSTK